MSEAYDPPLVQLPGTPATPVVVLHRTLNKAARIKAVTIVIQWDDDSFDIDWSVQKSSELCMAALMLQHTATRVATGQMPETILE